MTGIERSQPILQYTVTEIMHGYVGEGPYVGTPAVMVRFAGCNIRCATPCIVPNNVGVMMTLDEICDDVISIPNENVVITGGEPLLQNIEPLLDKLLTEKKHLIIETNGSIFDEEIMDKAVFIVKPKILEGTVYKSNSIEGYYQNIKKYADRGFFTFIVTNEKDLEDILTLLGDINPVFPVYFTPYDESIEKLKDKTKWLSDTLKNYSNCRVVPNINQLICGNRRGVSRWRI